MSPAVITAADLRTRMLGTTPPVVLDVRESAELEIASLPGSLHLPLSNFHASVKVLDRHADYVVVCHHGIRSADAATFMIQQGFTRVANLLGGIDAWACEVDPSMPRY